MTDDSSKEQMPRAFDVVLRVPNEIDEARKLIRTDPYAAHVVRSRTDDLPLGSAIRVPGPLIGIGLPGADIDQARAAATENVDIIEVGP